MPKLNLYQAVRTCSSDNWSNTGVWFAFTLGFGFLPLWIGVLLVWGLSHEQLRFADFIVHGEFAIYSATLVAGSMRLVAKDTELGPFVHRPMFFLVSGLTLTLAVAVYVTIKTATFLRLPEIVNAQFVIKFSVPLLIFSLLFGFLVFLLDHQRFHPNVALISEQQVADLGDQYDKLGGDNGR